MDHDPLFLGDTASVVFFHPFACRPRIPKAIEKNDKGKETNEVCFNDAHNYFFLRCFDLASVF